MHKGGLFGTDYRMLFPGDGIDGIKRFFLDTLIAFGKRGLCCQPAIVGVGVGGSKDTCMQLGKQAACLRSVGDRHPDPKIAALESELKEIGNNIGMGPMGFVGSSMVVDCHIEVGYTHTGGMPVSVHTFCLSSRRSTARIGADDHIEFPHRPAMVHTLYTQGDSRMAGALNESHINLPATAKDIANAGDRYDCLSYGCCLYRARRRIRQSDAARRTLV